MSEFIVEGLQALIREKNNEIENLTSKLDVESNVVGFFLSVIVKSPYEKYFFEKIIENNTSPFVLDKKTIDDFKDYFHVNGKNNYD